MYPGFGRISEVEALESSRRLVQFDTILPSPLRPIERQIGRCEELPLVSGQGMLGNAEAGIVASLFSIRTSVVSGGILCVLGTGVLALVYPAFWHYDGRAGVIRKQREEAERAAVIGPA